MINNPQRSRCPRDSAFLVLSTCFTLSLLLSTLGSAENPEPGGNWPQFRGPQASGIADGQNAPTQWDAETGENIVWKTPIPGLGHSSPVIWDEKLFLTTAVSTDANPVLRNEAGRAYGIRGDVRSAKAEPTHRWLVICLNKRTGEILWTQTAHEGAPRFRRHPKSTHANPTVATDGRHVAAYFGTEGLYCYSTEGELLWKKDLGPVSMTFARSDDQWGVASSPIIFNGMVFVQCDSERSHSFVVAYDVEDGEKIWRHERGELAAWATPTVYIGPTGPELITNAYDRIRGYDPETGKVLWWISGNSEIATPTPIFSGDLIYVGSGYVLPGIRPLYAVRAGSRGDLSLEEDEFSNEGIAWSIKKGTAYTPTPIVYDGILYNLDSNGRLTAFNKKTGGQLYRERVRTGARIAIFSASPIAADGHIFLTSEKGDTILLEAGTAYEVARTNSVGEVCMATPAISDGMIFIRSLHHVFGIGSLTSSNER